MPIKLPMFRRLVTIDETYLAQPIKVQTSPYEKGLRLSGLYLSGLQEAFGKIPSGAAYNVFKRKDFKLISAEGSNGGWTFQWIVRGKKLAQSNLKGGTGIICKVADLIDETGNGTLVVKSSGKIAGVIDEENGVEVIVAPDENTYTLVTAHTPDRMLSKTQLPRLPFINIDAVRAEEAKWRDIAQRLQAMADFIKFGEVLKLLGVEDNRGQYFENMVDILGYQTEVLTDAELGIDTSGMTEGNRQVASLLHMVHDIQTHSPFGGFAVYRDNWTAVPGELMEYVPPNEVHFLTKLTPQHAANELAGNHVSVNDSPLFGFFGTNFNPEDLTVYETGIVVLDVGPGSIQDILLESTKHGAFRMWWAADATFRYINDYCYGTYDLALDFQANEAMSATLKITLRSNGQVINRICVRGQWAAGSTEALMGGGTTSKDPLDSFFSEGRGSVYPTGATLSGAAGSDVIEDGYQGSNTTEQATRRYLQLSSTITAEISNFPYASVVLNAYNRVVRIWAVDAASGINWAGKAFVCEAASLKASNYEQPGGGYMNGTMQLKEIFTV